MKKMTLVLVAVLLALTSCQSRIPEFSAESSTVSASVATPAGNFEDPFPVSSLTGKSHEELLAEHPYAVYYNDIPMESCLDTPPVLYLKVSGYETVLAYDKATGNFSSACRDPLCDHEGCLWGAGKALIYRGANGLFFLEEDQGVSTLYATDFFGDSGEKLYSSEDLISHPVQEGDHLYFLLERLDEETDTIKGTVCRLHRVSGELEELLTEVDLYYFMPIGGKLLYQGKDGFSLYDPAAKESTPYGEGDLLPVALMEDDFYYLRDGILYRKSEYGTGDEERLTDLPVVELMFGGESLYFYGRDNLIYRADHDFSEVVVLHDPKTESSIYSVAIHGDLLYYVYSTGKGASRKQYTVMMDLATGKTLQVVT